MMIAARPLVSRLSATIAVLGSTLGLGLACGPSGPEMARVSGVVTYQGKPLEYGSVGFSPIDPGGVPAGGQIGPDGRYTLQTTEPGDGARLGKYRVNITTTKVEEVLDYIPKKPVKKAPSPIPEKYNNPQTAGIEVEVKSGANDIPIKLE